MPMLAVIVEVLENGNIKPALNVLTTNRLHTVYFRGSKVHNTNRSYGSGHEKPNHL